MHACVDLNAEPFIIIINKHIYIYIYIYILNLKEYYVHYKKNI